MSEIIEQITRHLALRLVSRVTHQRGTEVVKVETTGGETMALKVALLNETTAEILYNPTVVIQQEIKVLKALSSKLLISSGEYEGYSWLLTKWIDGESAREYLLRRLESAHDKKKEVVELMLDMVEAVEELHAKGFTHGDLQSTHFRCASGRKPILIDFGLARHLSDNTFLYEGALVFFNAPEVSRRKLEKRTGRVLDIISEVYSLGAVLFFTCTGKPLVAYHEDEDIDSAIVRGSKIRWSDTGTPCFPELETIIGKMTRVERSERYHSLQEVMTELRQALQ